jgi:Zn-dependent peptidase ImmA (M78 family)/DNA-binding XRE family transcriptional regulator
MEKSAAMKLGQKLRLAREKAGLSQVEACRRAEVGESSLSEFENGKRDPSLAQLEVLARVYSRSVASLLSNEPEPATTVLWRKRPAVGAEEVEAKFLRLSEQYANLERWSGDVPGSRLPSPVAAGSNITWTVAEEMARSVRVLLGLGDRPALALLQVLEEDYGVKVFHLPFEPTGTAACSRSQAFGDSILLNAGNMRWRRNYDLAHELFHLLTWNVFRSASGTSTEQEEQLADKFASALLLPEEALRSAVTRRQTDSTKLTTPALFDIAREFDVSVDAVVWRLHYLYGVKDPAYTRGRIEALHETAKLYEERGKDMPPPPPTRPERFRALAITTLRAGEISTGRFAEYLGISRGEAMKYVEMEGPVDEALELPSP